MNKKLSDLIDFSKLPKEIKEMLESLPEEGQQALVAMYDENSDLKKYGSPDNIAKDFLVDDAAVLCHYTEFGNLSSILENKKFWIKSKSYMNDPKEFLYTYELGEKLLRNLGATEDEICEFSKVTKQVNFDVYIWSFSENVNSQALWGNYGNKKGIAIKMNQKNIMRNLASHFAKGKSSLRKYKEGNGYVFPVKVLYNIAEQKERLSAILLQYLNAVRSFKFDPVDMNQIILECLSVLTLYALILKNPLLYQEEEVRFIINNINNGTGLVIKQQISGNDFLRSVGREGIDTRQVDNSYILVDAQGTFFFLHGYARKIAHMLITAGQIIKERAFTAVFVANKCKMKLHTSSASTNTVILLASEARRVSS